MVCTFKVLPGPIGLVTAENAPLEVRQLLKTYDPKQLRWAEPCARLTIVTEILTRGESVAKNWLGLVLPEEEVRELIKWGRGTGCSEPYRKLLRKQLKLTTEDIPVRAQLSGWP